MPNKEHPPHNSFIPSRDATNIRLRPPYQLGIQTLHKHTFYTTSPTVFSQWAASAPNPATAGGARVAITVLVAAHMRVGAVIMAAMEAAGLEETAEEAAMEAEEEEEAMGAEGVDKSPKGVSR